MTIHITPTDFDQFKVYARRLLNDFTQASVGSYVHNPAIQEVIVTWGEDAKAEMTKAYPKPENISGATAPPYASPIDAGAYDIKSLVKCFMEKADLREAQPYSKISEMEAGRFDLKIRDTCDDNLSHAIDCLAIRVNGDLAQALRALRDMNDNTIDTVCRSALEKTNILIRA